MTRDVFGEGEPPVRGPMPAGLPIVAAALLAPLASLMLLVSGLYAPGDAFDNWPAHLLWCGAFAALGAWIVQTGDWWLGIGVAVVGVNLLLLHGDIISQTIFALMAAGVVLCRQLAPHRHLVLLGLSVMGLLQALYVLAQWTGLQWAGWTPVYGAALPVIGTLGNPNKVGAYLAIVAPLMPWWSLPIMGAAVLASHSVGALLGLVVGLLIRYRAQWVAVAIALAGSACFTVLMRSKGWATAQGRWDIWAIGLRDWWASAPLMGYGLGAWAQRVPRLQTSDPGAGLWLQAHNDVVQLVYETGLVGLAILAAWIWDHRRAVLAQGVGGSVAALAVVSLTYYPFHAPTLVLLAVVILGLATAPDEAPTLTEGV